MTGPSIRIKRFSLLALFERAVKVVRTREVTDVLKNFLVEVHPEELRIVATDLELSVLASTSVFESVEQGRAILPAHKTLDIAKEAPDDEIEIKVDGRKASIVCADGSWELPVGDPDEYPPLPDINEIELSPVGREDLLKGISRVVVAASADGLRPQLMVVKLAKDYLLASDGVRIHRIQPSWRLPFDFYLPLGAAEQIISLLRLGVGEDIFIGQSKDHIVIKIDTDIFLSTKVAVDYPDTSPFFTVAQNNEAAVTIDKKELLSAISRVRLAADPDTNLLEFMFEDATMVLSCAAKSGESSVWRVQVSNPVADGFKAGFNWRYLREAVEAVDTSNVVLRLNSDMTQRQPALIEDGPFTALLRQLKL